MKRSGFQRNPLTRAADQPKATIKPKRCKVCRSDFFPARPMQIACSPACAHAYAAKVAAKKEADLRRAEGQQTRGKREAMKTLPDLTKEAQQAFNAFIRERDRLAGHACISSNRPLRWGEFGGAVDAGHYRSTGSAPHLRFNEDNCHAQSAQDNRHGAGKAVDYRIGLIARIGLARVEALESDNTPRKWTRDELRTIRDTYRQKLKALKKAAPSPNSGAQLGACTL